MSKKEIHFQVLGYEPLRMKPVHFASGFFLALTGRCHSLEWLNKATVIKHKDGLREGYSHDQLLSILREKACVDSAFSTTSLKLLRTQINGVMDNDDGVFAEFAPYRTFGNDYSSVSDRFLVSQKRLDGYAGYFVQQVLAQSEQGRAVLEFARRCIEAHGTPLERLVEPLLDEEASATEWVHRYEEEFGALDAERLTAVESQMRAQTAALSRLCRNLETGTSHSTQLRSVIIGLCSWLFIYMQQATNGGPAVPLLVMDFLGGENQRLRSHSRNCFARLREIFLGLYQARLDAQQLTCDEADFAELRKNGFKFLEQHFSDLAVRVGFAQPRAAQARRKHFELQPDTARILLKSIIAPGELCKAGDVALALRATWGVCYGGCDDDQATLQGQGYAGLDQDADLEPNADAFVSLLKTLNLAVEPSDGLVLCAAQPETLL